MLNWFHKTALGVTALCGVATAIGAASALLIGIDPVQSAAFFATAIGTLFTTNAIAEIVTKGSSISYLLALPVAVFLPILTNTLLPGLLPWLAVPSIALAAFTRHTINSTGRAAQLWSDYNPRS